MALNFETSDPGKLLAAFKAAIDAKQIVTWSYDQSGDFTHTPDQWRNHAWMRPSVENGRLVMRFFGRSDEVTTWEVYAVFHGRFIESMTAHCNKLFSEVRMPPNPTAVDAVTTKVA
jgi:hypothetical protein